MANGTCSRECVKIVTKITSYTVDGPISFKESLPGYAADKCPQELSDQEVADAVAAYIVVNRETVEEPPCPEGCTCRHYTDRADLRPRPLAPFNAKRCIDVVHGENAVICIYTVCFTVHIEQTVYPLGFCVTSEPEAGESDGGGENKPGYDESH